MARYRSGAGTRHKYGAKAIVIDGIRFASQAEGRRFCELKLLEKAGLIEGLECQPVFPLRVLLTTGTVKGAGQAHAGDYPTIGKAIMDFKYFRLEAPTGWVVEDVKGMDNPLSRWKRKHVEAQFGITVTLIGRATPAAQAKRASSPRRSNAQKTHSNTAALMRGR